MEHLSLLREHPLHALYFFLTVELNLCGKLHRLYYMMWGNLGKGDGKQLDLPSHLLSACQNPVEVWHIKNVVKWKQAGPGGCALCSVSGCLLHAPISATCNYWAKQRCIPPRRRQGMWLFSELLGKGYLTTLTQGSYEVFIPSDPEMGLMERTGCLGHIPSAKRPHLQRFRLLHPLVWASASLSDAIPLTQDHTP